MSGQESKRRLRELIGLVCDDRLDAETTKELEAILSDDSDAVQYYVESIDIHSRLHRQQGLAQAEQPDSDVTVLPESLAGSLALPKASPRLATGIKRPLLLLASAVCISLVLGTLAGISFSSTRAIATSNLQSQPFATLSAASGCRWSNVDGARYEGQRLVGESLNLNSGIAMVRFDSDVTLTIEGPARLDLVSVNRALLRKGKAVFSGMTDLDAFTLETPYSTILDEGTEYAVSIDPADDAVEVHVFDGRVQCDAGGKGDSPVRVDAGQARRFAKRGNDTPIPLAESRFKRKPTRNSSPSGKPQLAESFDYDTELVGQNGGVGWASRWRQINVGKANAQTQFMTTESIAWPGRNPPTDGGSLQIAGNTSLARTMNTPIRMDKDAAYYLSFLVQNNKLTGKPSSAGWAFLTLRGPTENKLAITPRSYRRTPKLIHNGQIANASAKLQDDTPHLIVVKILAQRDKADQIFVQVYKAADTIDSVEPLTWSFVTQPLFDDSFFDQIRIVSQSSQPILIDDIRLGKSWTSVTSDFQTQSDQSVKK